jgi:hypothetical protein
MKNVRKVAVKISSGSKHLEFEAQVVANTRADAIKKAALAYLASLVLAVICIAIPIVHFIAVPGILLFGPVLAFLVFKAFSGQEDLKVEQTACPNCKHKLGLATTLSLWPLRDRCENCKEPYLAEFIEKGPKI